MEKLAEQAERMGVSLTDDQLAQVGVYLSELEKWNVRINLVSSRAGPDLLAQHVLDSLTPIPHLEGIESLIDVGSGAGFPGIPIKIGRPGIRVYLIEARRKKCSFLTHVLSRLGLNGIEAIWARIEDPSVAARFSDQKVDCMIARASLTEEALFSAADDLLGEGGRIVLMKGAISEADRGKIETRAARYGREIVEVFPYQFPWLRNERLLVVIE
ncbi:MAG: 16S rRNA (guanine(527)-N(7))-methyltransferase RsmG [bacterium]